MLKESELFIHVGYKHRLSGRVRTYLGETPSNFVAGAKVWVYCQGLEKFLTLDKENFMDSHWPNRKVKT